MSNNTQRLRANNNNRVPVIGSLWVALSNMVNNYLSNLTDKLVENNTIGGNAGFEPSTLQKLNTHTQALFESLYGNTESSETSGDQSQAQE